jgi:glycosyltransferase involved in cell wall biosynthesis
MTQIVHIAKFYPPALGGIERVVETLADAARSAGHDVMVVCSAEGGRQGRSVTPTGVVVERLSTWFTIGTLPISPALPAALRGAVAKADIVHFHEPYPLATLWLLLLSKPHRLVITWHADILRQKRLKPLAEWVQHRLAGRADAILCTSKGMATSSPFLQHHAARIRIMPFLIDMTPYDSIRSHPERIAATRKRCGGRFVLACGRLISYKGFDVLIDALAGSDIRAIIVGKGVLLTDLQAQAQARGVTNQIVFAGAIEDEMLRDLYCACEFLVFPSVTPSEAFGIVQLEAMAGGRPVINTWLPTSVPHVSLDGVTGLTVPPRDPTALHAAMLQLWTDSVLREKFAAAALARVREHYERSRGLAHLLSFYDELLTA